jgi:hypothetical protein
MADASNIGIFHRKAAKVAKERKEVGKSGGETDEVDGKSYRYNHAH